MSVHERTGGELRHAVLLPLDHIRPIQGIHLVIRGDAGIQFLRVLRIVFLNEEVPHSSEFTVFATHGSSDSEQFLTKFRAVRRTTILLCHLASPAENDYTEFFL